MYNQSQDQGENKSEVKGKDARRGEGLEVNCIGAKCPEALRDKCPT